MSYLVLARKYRPQSFEQVVDQAHITRTLSNAIAADRVAHAILFSGLRGTGKTTVARILAKAMNCKTGPTPSPCNECRSCREITAGHDVDVYEIDGASNNSVDQVRELRENVKYMPAHSLCKIYIIDEVHMLSTSAFNALLKTLEEPPAHVMFIFATTEPHKIPTTILSRCQRHDFKRIMLESIKTHLAFICKQEGFEIEANSLGIIAKEAGGSMRDAISLLDQVMSCSQDSITHEQLLDVLGVVDRKYLFDLAGAVLARNLTSALDLTDDIYDRGHDLKTLYADLLEHFRNLLVVKMGKKINKLVDLPQHEIDQLEAQAQQQSAAGLNQIFDLLFQEEASIRLAVQPKLAFEMVLVRLFQYQPVLPIDELIDKLDRLRQVMADGPGSSGFDSPNPDAVSSPKGFRQQNGQSAQQHSSVDPDEHAAPPSTVPRSESRSNLEAVWKSVYEQISQENPSLAANLTKCSLSRVSEDRIDLEVVGNGFTLNMIKRDKNMALLKKHFANYFGHEKRIVLTSQTHPDENNQKKKTKDNQLKQRALSHPLVADAIEIFDGKLVDVKIRNH